MEKSKCFVFTVPCHRYQEVQLKLHQLIQDETIMMYIIVESVEATIGWIYWRIRAATDHVARKIAIDVSCLELVKGYSEIKPRYLEVYEAIDNRRIRTEEGGCEIIPERVKDLTDYPDLLWMLGFTGIYIYILLLILIIG